MQSSGLHCCILVHSCHFFFDVTNHLVMVPFLPKLIFSAFRSHIFHNSPQHSFKISSFFLVVVLLPTPSPHTNLDTVYEGKHAVFIFQNLFFLFSIMTYSFIYFSTNVMISFPLWMNKILLCICATFIHLLMVI